MTFLVLLPIVAIAGFAMYLQYKSLNEARRKSPVWLAFCIIPVATVGILLLWASFR